MVVDAEWRASGICEGGPAIPAVHQVSREHALERLKLPGWRMATGEEIARYNGENAIQVAGRPFGTPWQPGGDELHTWDG